METIFTFVFTVLLLGFVNCKSLRGVDEFHNPEENEGLFEGDIITDSFRNGVQGKEWPDGIVHIAISDEYKPYEKAKIIKNLKIIEDRVAVNGKKCIQFLDWVPGTRAYIEYMPGSGCSSSVGMTGFKQLLRLSSWGCLDAGRIQHETVHALGFYHEQSRPDRDNYVEIKLENIKPDHAKNFDKLPDTQTYGQTYDYGSLMHYGPTTFSSNGEPTIVPKKAGVTIGQRDGLSDIDVEKIRIRYKCYDK
ncbi:low choriolytic enzyme-like [Tubulanus polymorphus]|uniref:low choriolytic enzyme-like n=1 Tax=Tubulanus polymorphus TaxID=672921 RepID=UPI003DA63597